ncbi:hypothetical protein KJ678_03910 [Patescibacteria group bacterium]|nr:hypothetical protein [Patescibacteria group bacterium]
MNKNSISIINRSLLISLSLTASFMCLFVFGLHLARIAYLYAFGEPYEMGWLLLYSMGKITGFIFGSMGTLLFGILVMYFDKKRLLKISKGPYPTIKIFLTSYLFFILELFILLVIINTLIPPCPNCYK